MMFVKTAIYSVVLSLLCNSAIATSLNQNLEKDPTSRTEFNKNLEVAQSKQSKPLKALVDKVWDVINNQFIDTNFNGVDWQQVRQKYVIQKSYDQNIQAYIAIDEMLDLLGDPLTRFVAPKEFASMKINASEVGNAKIGLKISKNKTTGQIKVESSYPDSPAFAAGINYGDLITKINDRSIQGMEAFQVESLLRGEEGSVVKLAIEQNSTETNFYLKRELIEIEAVDLKIKEVDDRKIAYIKLNIFDADVVKDTRKAIVLAEFQNIAAYVLDLRGNSGDLIYPSIVIAQMWLDEGTVVSTLDRTGISNREFAKNKALTDKPLAVLVNNSTASGSEILTAALQDNNRAIIVGEQTKGTGSIQSVHPLPDGSGLVITTSTFLIPSGHSIQDKGIEPDLKLELTQAQKANIQRHPELLATKEDLIWTEAIAALEPQLSN